MKTNKPKYLQIFNEISILIRNQTLKAGDLLPTEAELCKKYNVSRPTIAKAVNLLVKEKKVWRKAGFGTQILALRRNTLAAGLLIPRMNETEIFKPICASLIETAGIAGMRIIHTSEHDHNPDPQNLANSLADQFIEEKVRGVFFTPVEHIPDQEKFNLSIIKRLRSEGIQIVLLDRDVYSWPKQSPYDLVGIDNIEAGFILASHLFNNGCKKLAFVSTSNPAMTVQLRRIGCREALVYNGQRASNLTDIRFITKQPETAAKQILASNIDGIICSNDATAAPLMRTLVDLGADIPNAIKVCGFDDVKYASLLSVPLSSYHQPCSSIGEVAAQVMLNRIKNPDSPTRRITLKGKLIIRNSSQNSK
jgi:DNA-binding LacI/PurR family transcriptional regulator